jgi:dTMP kinase
VTRGLFIAIEGGEGAGKSTQTRLLAEYLQSQGYEVVVTREPGGTATAEKIRKLLLDPDVTDMPNQTEALLFAAARADHAHNLIRPALDGGAVVICDRYIDSSVAYQGLARALGADYIRSLSLWATSDLVPDFTIYLNVPLEESALRMDGTDRMEIQSRDFHRVVHQAFSDIANNSTLPHIQIDGTQPKHDIAEQINTALEQVLAKR